MKLLQDRGGVEKKNTQVSTSRGQAAADECHIGGPPHVNRLPCAHADEAHREAQHHEDRERPATPGNDGARHPDPHQSSAGE